jgi:parallel beta-helix repeat protein
MTFETNANFNNITNNTIKTKSQNAPGIYLLTSTKENNITDNVINTSDSGAHGFHLDSSNNNTIINNKINTTASSAMGFYIFTSSNNNFVDNTIDTSGTASYGFYLYQSSKNNITFSTINTKGTDGYGIGISSSMNNSLTSNTLRTSNDSAYGIWLANSKNNEIVENTINNTGSWGDGIYLSVSDHNDLINNTIITYKGSTRGIMLQFTGTNNNSIIGNKIRTYGSASYGIELAIYAIDNNITGNTVNTSNQNAVGIMIRQWSDYNNVMGNRINTSGSGATGIQVESNTIGNMISEASIHTTNTSAYGIRIYSSNKTLINNCTISTLGANAGGILLDSLFATVIDTKIDSSYQDFFVANDGNMTAINCNFTTSYSVVGVLQVKNYLSLQAYYEDLVTPIDNGDVLIDDNGMVVYSTVGYGGTKPQLNATGRIDNVIVTDRWYFYSNIATENVTTVKVKKTVNATWEEIRGVNMDTSHTEIFIATDIFAPTRPTGLTASPILNDDALNISWDLNSDDTVNYELWWRTETGSWVLLGNISQSTTWYVLRDSSLVNGTNHYFRLRAWDDVNITSDFTDPFVVIHRDHEPPEVPTNLAAQAVSETKINLTWSASSSNDVEYYGIYMNYPSSGAGGPYEYITEVTAQIQQYQMTGLSENETYYFVVVAFDDGKNPSGNSNEAMDTTIAVPPITPILNILPKNTNVQIYNVTGSADANVRVFIYNNGVEGANGSTNVTGAFGIEITLVEGDNDINARAFDQADLPSDFSLTQTVRLDITNPIASAGDDHNITVGTEITFNGTASSDNYEIVSYSWSFDYNGSTKKLNGIEPPFIFDIIGNYEVTLMVTDPAGNTGTDTVEVLVNEKVVVDTESPIADAGADQAVKTGNKVSFDGSGSSDNEGISNYTWTFEYNNTDVVLYGESPSYDFELEGEYEVTLTVIDLTVPPNRDTDTVWINVTPIMVNNDIDDDGMWNDWEDEHGFNKTDPNDAALDADDDDLTNLNEYMKQTDPHDPDSDDDGMTDGWEVDYKLDPLDDTGDDGADGDPDKDGYTNLEEFEAKTDPLDKKDNPGDDEEPDNFMMYLAIIIIIIIVLLLIIGMAMRKKKPAEEEEEEEEGEGEFEEIECAECGAVVPGIEIVCPECGAQLPEKEETEEEAEDEEGEKFECPDCGADLAAGESVCPECGAEFEEDEDEEVPAEEEMPDEELEDELTEEAESDEDLEDELEE